MAEHIRTESSLQTSAAPTAAPEAARRDLRSADAAEEPARAPLESRCADAETLEGRERALEALAEQLAAKEAALEETAERMRIALASARVGTWSWDFRTGCVNWSEEQYQLLGHEPYSVEPSFDFLLSCVHPDDLAHGEREFQAGRREGRAYDIEFRVIWPNGEVHWLQSRGRFTRDEAGKLVQMSGVTLDIDRLKEAERAANEARERLSTIAEATPGTIFTFRATRDGKRSFPYATAHLRETHGIDPEDLAQDPSLMFARLHPDDYDRVVASTAESARTMSMWHSQFRHFHPQKGEIWIEAYSSPLREPDGSITWHGIAHDVTDIKRAEAELLKARQKAEAADRAKSEFLANMSHEIRTPMSAIMGYADILSARLKDPDNLQSLDTIRSNGHYLLEIIDDILDLSRIEAGRLDLDLKRVCPARLVRNVQSLMKLRAADKGLVLAVEFDGPLPETIETDATRLRQILINLVENAIKFTEQGEIRVVVRVDAEAPRLAIDVVDTGVGIPETTLAKLFRPFTQADSSLTRRFGGSGLGLSICRALAKLLGGDVTVTSRLGEGSTFTVTIAVGDLTGVPLRDVFWSDPVPVAPPQPVRQLACRVLVVDDRREMRHLAEHMLEEAGAQVELAVDGRDALGRVRDARARGRDFDAILLDMQMPVLDGYAAATELRRRGFDKAIIALTANAMKEDERKCLACGCDAYLSKPLDRGTLIDMIAHCAGHGGENRGGENRGRSPISEYQAREDRSRSATERADGERGAGTAGSDPDFRVLVVDDSHDVCAMLKLLLESAGYRVTTAVDGPAALAAARANAFDAVVMDLGLPGMSGSDIVAELKSGGGSASCRFIGLSGRALPEREWRGLGFDHYLQKPARLDALKALLDKSAGTEGGHVGR